MFWRLLWESFARQRRRKLLAGTAIFLGVTAVTAMLGLATTIGNRIHSELAVYGANIVVFPKADTLEVKVGEQTLKPTTGNATLHESDLTRLRTIFWANNITGVSPELRTPLAVLADGRGQKNGRKDVEAVGLWFGHTLQAAGAPPLVTGVGALHPAWKLQGAWPADGFRGELNQPTKAPYQVGAAVGSTLAAALGLHVGDTLLTAIPFPRMDPPFVPLNLVLHVTGIVSTGDATDNTVLLPLDLVQQIANTPDAVSRVDVSATTKPEDAFARRDPDTLKPKDRDVWYCRPYANSIAYQIREAIPGAQAEQVRQVEQAEGTILERIGGLMWLISAAALLAAAVAVSAAMATAVLERRAEIGLMRSLGASKARVATLFYAEAGLLAVVAGTFGYLAGCLLAALLTAKIFGGGVMLAHAFLPALFPVVLGVALLVALAGSTPSIRGALRLDPNTVLRASA